MKKSSHLNQERNMHKSITVYKAKESKRALNKYVGGFWCERQQETDFFIEESNHMDYGILSWSKFEVKHLNDGFVSYKHAAFVFTRH